MFDALFLWAGEAAVWTSVGMAVAWNFPQPPWAKWGQAKIVAGYQWAKAQLSK